MLARVGRLERATRSPLLNLFGPMEKLEAEVHAGVADGRYDPRDMPVVLASVKRWTRQESQLHVLSHA